MESSFLEGHDRLRMYDLLRNITPGNFSVAASPTEKLLAYKAILLDDIRFTLRDLLELARNRT